MKVHWGVAVAVFYTAFALATIGFVVFAMTSDVGLVADDYYARALAHDAHMQATANAQALGTALGAALTPQGVVVRVPASMVSHLRGTATLYRAADARADRTVPLAPGPDGTQVLSIAGLPPGRWRLEMRWTAEGRDYYAERDLRLP